MRWNSPAVTLTLLFIFIAVFIDGQRRDDDLLVTLAVIGFGLNALAWVRWISGK